MVCEHEYIIWIRANYRACYGTVPNIKPMFSTSYTSYTNYNIRQVFFTIIYLKEFVLADVAVLPSYMLIKLPNALSESSQRGGRWFRNDHLLLCSSAWWLMVKHTCVPRSETYLFTGHVFHKFLCSILSNLTRYFGKTKAFWFLVGSYPKFCKYLILLLIVM
jgi:hypothetical protein